MDLHGKPSLSPLRSPCHPESHPESVRLCPSQDLGVYRPAFRQAVTKQSHDTKQSKAYRKQFVTSDVSIQLKVALTCTDISGTDIWCPCSKARYLSRPESGRLSVWIS